MENHSQSSGRRHREQSASASPSSRRSLRRKLNEEHGDNRGSVGGDLPAASHQDLMREIRAQVEILDTVSSSAEQDRASAKRAIHVLSELAKNEDMVNLIVDCAAVPVLVKHLRAPPPLEREGEGAQRLYEHEVEKGSAFTLGLLAIKPEHQQLIVDAGALTHLVDLLIRHADDPNSRVVSGVIRRAADAITNLAHENSSIKTCVRIEGGIPPLVELLEFADPKVQRAAAGALRTLAFKNDENKNQIVECNALPTLILMLRSEDTAIHYEAVGVIGNLVHSSPNIKKEVLVAGALQPVIGLLRCLLDEEELSDTEFSKILASGAFNETHYHRKKTHKKHGGESSEIRDTEDQGGSQLYTGTSIENPDENATLTPLEEHPTEPLEQPIAEAVQPDQHDPPSPDSGPSCISESDSDGEAEEIYNAKSIRKETAGSEAILRVPLHGLPGRRYGLRRISQWCAKVHPEDAPNSDLGLMAEEIEEFVDSETERAIADLFHTELDESTPEGGLLTEEFRRWKKFDYIMHQLCFEERMICIAAKGLNFWRCEERWCFDRIDQVPGMKQFSDKQVMCRLQAIREHRFLSKTAGLPKSTFVPDGYSDARVELSKRQAKAAVAYEKRQLEYESQQEERRQARRKGRATERVAPRLEYPDKWLVETSDIDIQNIMEIDIRTIIEEAQKAEAQFIHESSQVPTANISHESPSVVPTSQEIVMTTSFDAAPITSVQLPFPITTDGAEAFHSYLQQAVDQRIEAAVNPLRREVDEIRSDVSHVRTEVGETKLAISENRAGLEVVRKDIVDTRSHATETVVSYCTNLLAAIKEGEERRKADRERKKKDREEAATRELEMKKKEEKAKEELKQKELEARLELQRKEHEVKLELQRVEHELQLQKIAMEQEKLAKELEHEAAERETGALIFEDFIKYTMEKFTDIQKIKLADNEKEKPAPNDS